MKDVSNTIQNYLNTEKHFTCCDLYSVTLANASTYYISGGDTDVSWNGRNWTKKMILTRGQVKASGEPNVDTMSVDIACDSNDTFGGTSFMELGHSGQLNGGVLTVYRAYFDSTNTCIGAFPVFSGKTEISSAGGLKVKLNVKAETQGLNQQIPLRVFAPQTAYMTDTNGDVVISETDTVTMLVPLKPSNNVLLRING